MNTALSAFRSLALAGATLLLLTAAPRRAHAAFTLTLTETAGNVVVNGAGSINLAALTLSRTVLNIGQINPSSGLLINGPFTDSNTTYYIGGGLTGPAGFGSGPNSIPSSGTGSFVGVSGATLRIYVPQNYVSDTVLTNSMTFNNATLATLGVTPGTYTYTWGAGGNADSLTVTAVTPVPRTGDVGGGRVDGARRRPRAAPPPAQGVG